MLEESKHKREGNIKTCPTEIMWDGVDRVCQFFGRRKLAGCCKDGNQPLRSIKYGEFLTIWISFARSIGIRGDILPGVWLEGLSKTTKTCQYAWHHSAYSNHATSQCSVPEEVMLFEADYWSRACQQYGTLKQTWTDAGYIRAECLHGNDVDQKIETVTRLSREAVNIL